MLPRIVFLASTFVLVASDAFAQAPVVVDTALTWTATLTFANAQSARFDPLDSTALWVGRRGTGTDGVYHIGFSGRAEHVSTGSNVAAFLTDTSVPAMVFFSEDFGGVIYRVDASVTPAVRSTWVSGFHGGDDDPVGMAIAPTNYTGGLVTPGTAIVVDRGFNGPDEIWAWSATVAQTQQLLVPDMAAFVDPVDVAFDANWLYIADSGEAGPGHIWRIDGAGTLSELVLSTVLAQPQAVTIDPLTQELLVTDSATGSLVAVDTTSGAVRNLVTGLTIGGDEWSGIDVRPDGSQILVTAGSSVYTFSRCTTGLTSTNDCDSNGVLDYCELAAASANDCNANGIPDACDIASGASTDCEGDGVPDDCPSCPPVELVVMFDTSASMDDEAGALCSEVTAIQTEFDARGIAVTTELLGISAAPGGAYACLQDHVISRYGTVVPGSPPVGNETLGMCPGGNEVASEDWGRATSVVAGTKVWAPGTVRVVVPIADEGPWCGDPVNAFDDAAIVHAIATSTATAVRVFPITGTGSSQAVVDRAVLLANGTGGIHQRTTAATIDIPRNVLTLVRNACFAAVDCNNNQIVDSCDITPGGGSLDCDFDGTPDECQVPVPDCPPPDAGVDGGVDSGVMPDAGDLDAGDDADAASRDVGVRDGGPVVPRDGGAVVSRDGGTVSRDGGTSVVRDGGTVVIVSDGGAEMATEESCDCHTTRRRRGSPWWAGIVVFALWRRRTRRGVTSR